METVRRVTDAQVKELRNWLHRGASLSKAAMKADMDRKSARKYRDCQRLPSEGRGPRTWRTRRDPLAAVWPELEALLEQEPALQAVTLLDWLQRTYPGEYPDGVRRTLERRVRTWKAQHGPDKEVYFAQVHEPGRLGASDFTHMSNVGVTIAGRHFRMLVEPLQAFSRAGRPEQRVRAVRSGHGAGAVVPPAVRTLSGHAAGAARAGRPAWSLPC